MTLVVVVLAALVATGVLGVVFALFGSDVHAGRWTTFEELRRRPQIGDVDAHRARVRERA